MNRGEEKEKKQTSLKTNLGEEMKRPGTGINKSREEMPWMLPKEKLLFPTDNSSTSLGTQIVLDLIQAKKQSDHLKL